MSIPNWLMWTAVVCAPLDVLLTVWILLEERLIGRKVDEGEAALEWDIRDRRSRRER
jgi:hypothetical protein